MMKVRIYKYLPGTLLALLQVIFPNIAKAHLEPVEMVRNLQIVQDDVAAGRTGALKTQARALAEMSNALHDADPAIFAKRENLYALLTYLFNGGNPKIVEEILRKVPEDVVHPELIKGALAYAHNHKGKLLQSFVAPGPENADWPEALRASVYLGTVGDLIDKEPLLAEKRLDYVRLVAPGSLFEEAAIRRQIKVSTRLGDVVKIQLLIRNYSGRFSRSPYAKDFWNELIWAVPKIEEKLTDDQLEQLVSLTPIQVNYLIYLRIARAALIDGRTQRAFVSAKKANAIAVDYNLENSMAKLYLAASQAGSPEASEAAKILQSISEKDLPVRDRPLLAAAQAVARGVAYYPNSVVANAVSAQNGLKRGIELPKDDDPWMPDISGFGEDKPSSDSLVDTEKKQPNADDIDDFLKKAQEKLDAVDELLEEP